MDRDARIRELEERFRRVQAVATEIFARATEDLPLEDRQVLMAKAKLAIEDAQNDYDAELARQLAKLMAASVLGDELGRDL